MDDELPTDIPEACRHPWTMNCLRIPSVWMSEIPGVGLLEELAMPEVNEPDYISWYYYYLVLLLLTDWAGTGGARERWSICILGPGRGVCRRRRSAPAISAADRHIFQATPSRCVSPFRPISPCMLLDHCSLL